MTTITRSLEVSRSNLAERLKANEAASGFRQRQRKSREDDVWLLPMIRQITDLKPSYGYRRVTALLRPAATSMGSKVAMLTAGILMLWAPVDSFAMSTSPAALTFSGTTGATNPPAQTITFWKSGDRTKNWTITASAPWISVTPSSGTIATEQDQITVSVNATGLSAGSYTSTVVISTESFKGRQVKTIVPVSLSLTQSSTATPIIQLSPAALSFSGIAGSANPAAQLLSLTNSSGGSITVQGDGSIQLATVSSSS